VYFDLLNKFSRLDTVGVDLGSGLALVTLFIKDKYDTEDLVGSYLCPFTSLLGATTSAKESPGEKYAV
jgi:hypothetical protein